MALLCYTRGNCGKLSDTRKLVFVGETYVKERSESQKVSLIVKYTKVSEVKFVMAQIFVDFNRENQYEQIN